MQANPTTQGVTMFYELELIDDAFCDIYAEGHLKPGTEQAFRAAIDQLQKWREQYGFTYPA